MQGKEVMGTSVMRWSGREEQMQGGTKGNTENQERRAGCSRHIASCRKECHSRNMLLAANSTTAAAWF